MLVVGQLVLRHPHHLGGEVVVDVVDLPGGNRHIPGGLDGRTVVVNGARAAGNGAVVVQRAADSHTACAVDQAVVGVIQRLHAEVHTLAPGQRRRGAVFGEVVEGIHIYAHRVAVDPSGADVGQGVRIDAGSDPVDQTGIAYRAGGRQGGVPGVDVAAGEVGQVGALHIEGAACHQLAAVGEIPVGGEGQVAVGDGGAGIVHAVSAVEIHIPQRQQLAAGIQRRRVYVQGFTRFQGAACVDQIQAATAKIQGVTGGQRPGAVVQHAAVIDAQRVIRQDAAALVIQGTGIERQALALQPLVFTEGILVNKVQGVEGHAFAAADQPGSVIHHAPGAVEEQFAHRLDLPPAVLQILAVQGGIGFANHPPTAAVIKIRGCNIRRVAGGQGARLVIEAVCREGQRPQAVKGTCAIIDGT